MKSLLSGSALFAVLVAPSQVFGQNADWQFTATGYLWMIDTSIGVGTPLGNVSGELSFSDALKDLELAAMGSLAASNGTWTVFGDLMYLDLSAEALTPGGLAFTDVDVQSTTTIFSTLVTRRVFESLDTLVDLGGGFRYIDIGNEVNFSGGVATPATSKVDSDWTDLILGARVLFSMNDTTSVTFAADYGGFGGDTESWQALVTLDYALDEQWSLRAGYRHLEFENTAGGVDLDVELSGPIIGVTYQF